MSSLEPFFRLFQPRCGAMLPAAVLVLLASACDSKERECSRPSDCGPGLTCLDGRCVPLADADADADVTEDVIDAPGDEIEIPVDTPVNPDVEGDPPVGAGCSADLRSVLDYSGNVLYECPEDQGCLEGRCVPACEAAAATRGTVSCEFLVPTPPAYPPALPPCLAVFVANAWPHPARVDRRPRRPSGDIPRNDLTGNLDGADPNRRLLDAHAHH